MADTRKVRLRAIVLHIATDLPEIEIALNERVVCVETAQVIEGQVCVWIADDRHVCQFDQDAVCRY